MTSAKIFDCISLIIVDDQEKRSVFGGIAMTVAVKDRILGCLLAGACGDALGAPFEFTSHIEMIVECGPGGVRNFWTEGGLLGAITDDTQLTLFTASGLLARRQFRGLSEVEHFHLAYLAWFSTQGERNGLLDQHPNHHAELASIVSTHGDRCAGFTCLNSLRDAKHIGQFANNTSKGCGAAMRVAPIGLLYMSDPYQAFDSAVAAARLTHGHPTGYISAGAFAMLIAWVLKECSLADALQKTLIFLRSQPGHEETSKAIINAPWPNEERVRPPSWMGFGWTGEQALAIAINAVLTTKCLQEAIIVAANHDGDSDTTASMAGNLAGALYGVSAIPQRWIEKVEMRSEITQIARKLCRAMAECSRSR